MAEIQLSDLGQESALSRDLAWLELALAPNDPDERKHFVYVDEHNGKRIMVASNRDRLHLSTQYAMCFPLGYVPREGKDWYAPDEKYFNYKPTLKHCTGAKAVFARELLTRTVQQFVKAMGQDHREMIMRFDPNRATLSAFSVLKGHVSVTIPCSIKERPETMRIDARYLLDAITGSDAQHIMLQQTPEPNGAVCVYPGNERVAFIKLREVTFSLNRR